MNKYNKNSSIAQETTHPRHAAFSYVEVIISVVIISVLIVATMRTFGGLGRSRQNTLEKDSANLLALDMIREIKQLHYEDPGQNSVFGTEPDETSETRDQFDDIDDYNNWSANPPQDRQGQPLMGYGDITRSVLVRFVSANNFDEVVGNDEGFKGIAIEVMRGDNVITRQKYIIPNAILSPPQGIINVNLEN